MPLFPNGTSIRLTDHEGRPMPEYGEEVLVDEGKQTHTKESL